MHLYAIHFSPTGGTKKVMNCLAANISKDYSQISLMNPNTDYGSYSFGSEDLCLVGVPAFGGRVPDTALERLKQMKVEGAMAVAVAIYGNRHYDDTLLELKNELESVGFTVIAGIAANAKHSIFTQYGAGRPDAEDKENLKKFAEAILCKLDEIQKNDGVTEPITVPGNVPYKEYPGHPLKPITNENCVLCGACVNKCPTAAIPHDAPDTTLTDRCITCMACIAACPFDARSLNKEMVAASAQKMAPLFEGRKPNELFL